MSVELRHYPELMSEQAGLRVADADKEGLVEELREHMLAGRLTPDEFEERLGAAYQARTQADLNALKADLPVGPATVDRAIAQRRSHLQRRLLQESGGAIGLTAVCVAIWASNGGEGQFWPIWVIIATLIPLVRNAWLLFGPAPDPDAVEAHLNRRRGRQLDRER
jgi:hypothetical protein